MNTINQKIVLQAGSFGLIMGILNTLGYTKNFELLLWGIILIGSSILVLKKVDAKIFIHCILIGLCWGVDTTFIEALFLETYINNNLYISGFIQKTSFINPRISLILLGILGGFIAGTILYCIQLILKKFN
tara:strand:+ start:402 stop:794 length:393 start_codon:yes stop_codon:yes gene_type:complete